MERRQKKRCERGLEVYCFSLERAIIQKLWTAYLWKYKLIRWSLYDFRFRSLNFEAIYAYMGLLVIVE